MKTKHEASRTQLLLDERGATHGQFCAVAYWSQELKRQIRLTAGWQELTIVQREVLDMVMLKVARIINGDPNHIDHYLDILGYVQLAVNDMKGDKP